MIIKSIMCMVNQDQKTTFSRQQQEWQALSEAQGFLGQIGGWSVKNPLKACIFGFWENLEAYDYFMNEIHDRIFIKSGQKGAYTSIQVDLFQEEVRILGSKPDLGSVLQHSNFIRTAFSHVKEEKIEHFIEMQQTVWNPGMKKAKGMLGGEFAVSQKNNQNFLVLTGWENQDTHQNYIDEHFPNLKKTAEPEKDVFELKGEQFAVEEAWRVCPTLKNMARNPYE